MICVVRNLSICIAILQFNTGWHFADDIILTSDEALEQDRYHHQAPSSRWKVMKIGCYALHSGPKTR